ncbi:hypothetical protein LSH36_965g01077 [Paralvinella palmiformis]|uniref:Uncharacterized protein n=1 Tax=Paralvinella palmiformis TaxID=53620 RepID=A0AAD9MTF4_9ANNE|nr:hypothetical protein LSH36_965g01077 [Paralvinella palmiformis]
MSQYEKDACDVKNLNDVCFGCRGDCGDKRCRKSSHSRAELGSAHFRIQLPQDKHSSTQQQQQQQQDEGHSVIQSVMDAENSNIRSDPNDINNDSTSDRNGNSQSNSPVKIAQRSPASPPKCTRSPKSPRSPRNRGKKFKRLRSSSDAPDESPSKKGHTQKSCESLASEAGCSKGSRTPQDISSSSGGEPDSDDDIRENRIVRTPYRSAFNSENGLSEEDNEENTSEHSVRNTPDQLLSSLSAENLQMELSKCSSDGLSDKENVVRNLKNQVKHPVDSLTLPPLVDSESSSDSEGCTEETVSTAKLPTSSSHISPALQNGW